MSICLHALCVPYGRGRRQIVFSPFKTKNFWAVAKPGDALYLLDGTYRGGSLISPPPNLSGSPDAPITIRALYDGNVLLDGQGKTRPVLLASSD